MARTSRKTSYKIKMGVSFHRNDPYIPRRGWTEPTICKTCDAVYAGKKWSFNKKLLEKARKDKSTNFAICPGCQKVKDHFSMGTLTLSGEFLKEHKNQILDALKNEAKRAGEKNPLERIISFSSRKGELVVETTSDQLALRMGRFLSRTYKGKADYKFAKSQKFARIHWTR